MERKFKVGDRVRHEDYGCGTVADAYPGECNFPYSVKFDSGLHDVFAEDDNELMPIKSPMQPEPPKYDRAMIAAMCLQGVLSNATSTEYLRNSHSAIAEAAVSIADALITELEKPKQ
jgi:hypothetical protein